MKHILNNLSNEEKNSIREQHTGGMKVMTENFSKLLNSKLGDSKPLVNEQESMDDYTYSYYTIIDMSRNNAMMEEGDLDEIEKYINDIYKIMNEAQFDKELSDEQADEIINYATEVIEELESMFDSESPMYEQSSKDNKTADFISDIKKELNRKVASVSFGEKKDKFETKEKL